MAYNRRAQKAYLPRRRSPVAPRLKSAVAPAPEVVFDIDELARKAKESKQTGVWIPPVFDVCPSCKARREAEEKQKKQQPPPPSEEEPPKTVDIDEQQSGGTSSPPPTEESEEEGEAEEEQENKPEESGKEPPTNEEAEDSEPEQKESQGKSEPEGDEEEGGESEEESGASEPEEKESAESESEEQEEEKPGGKANEEPEEEEIEEPPPASPEEVEQARKGADNVNNEFDQANKTTVDLDTAEFEPVASAADPMIYRDQKFISEMNTALKDWKTGYKSTAGPSGSKFKVKEFIRSKGEEPFITREQKSAKGRKILVIGDFSGSVAPFEDEYKKAIVSSMEILDGIGSKTAFFAFGGQTGDGTSYPGGSFDARASFFKIKKFEEAKWLQSHSAKTSALTNAGGTPMATAYEKIASYVKTHRPEVTITLTDGVPDDSRGIYNKVGGRVQLVGIEAPETQAKVNELKRYTKMVAFGIGGTLEGAAEITKRLKTIGYSKTFGVASVREVPKKLVGMIAPT
ncbi:MAG: hypothetical protein ABSE15_00470 [Candidatus Bathyarchaeia archaeon]|jgi:hypothetical protein